MTERIRGRLLPNFAPSTSALSIGVDAACGATLLGGGYAGFVYGIAAEMISSSSLAAIASHCFRVHPRPERLA
jgi:hypothetical protein